ncbi:hypothetical protein EPO44_21980 [bacterium]|nr:MAG: hypothetical protein EPO44_21980 [bacterium]
MRRHLLGYLLLGTGIVLAIGGAVEFLAIDRCLDMGGVYDYSARRCSLDAQPMGAPDNYDVLAFFLGLALVGAGWVSLATIGNNKKESDS